jgi:hypothetical protein
VGLHGQYLRFTAMSGGIGQWGIKSLEVWGDLYEPPNNDIYCDFPTIRTSIEGNPWTFAGNWLGEYGLTPPPFADQHTWAMLLLALCRLGQIRSTVDGLSGGGTCQFDDQPTLDAIAALDAVVDSGISAIAANDNANTAAIQANDNANTSGLITHINDKIALVLNDIATLQATIDNALPALESAIINAISTLTTHVSTEHADTRNAVWWQLFDPTTGLLRQVNDNTNAAELAINGNIDAAETAILAAIAGVQADTDDIQLTLANLPSNPAALRLWPGLAGVTFAAPVVLSAPGQITAQCHGVTVTIDSYPPGQSRQPAGSTIRHKGIAWLAFVNDAGDFEALEQIHHSEQVIITRQLEIASGCAVYCKPGCTLTITPFTIDAL